MKKMPVPKVNFDRPGPVKLVYKGRFISFMTKNGWEYVARHNCKGIVIIVAMTEQKKIIFVEQFRLPLKRKSIEFPAGLIADQGDGSETALRAAKRELLEETGYRAKRYEVLACGPVSGGLTSDCVTMVRAHGLKKVAFGGGDSTEDLSVHEVPLGEVDQWLKKMVRQNYAIEPKIYAGLYFLKKYNE